MSYSNTFSTLYKLNSNGKLLQWTVSVVEGESGFYIITEYGQTDGALQTTSDLITKGKNLGKKNETDAYSQALAEATSKWEIQQRIKGYVQDRERALRGEDDRQGFSPMLAKSYDEHGSKIKWPAAQQPKLDGMRAVALISDSEVKLFSRNGKPITAVPHIEKQLFEAFSGTGLTQIDGELYNHDLKHDFEKIISVAKKSKQIDEDKVLQYHIYDVAGTTLGFTDRYTKLRMALFDGNTQKFSHLFCVTTKAVLNEREAQTFDALCLEDGYEGSMLRNIDSLYEEGKRSFHLQKVKLFQEGDFTIVGIEEGRGKLAGHAASFVCLTSDGKRFKAKIEGSLERLKEYLENPSLWDCKVLTVCYQNLTKDGVPRFPIGKVIRDYE